MAWPPGDLLPAGWTYFESDVYHTILASAPAVAIDATQYHLEAPSVRVARTSSVSGGGSLYASFGPITTSGMLSIAIKVRQAINAEAMSTTLYIMQAPGDFSQAYHIHDTTENNTGDWVVLNGAMLPGTWYVCIGAWRGAQQSIGDQQIWLDEPVGFGVAAPSADPVSVAWPVEIASAVGAVSVDVAWPVAVLSDPARWMKRPLPVGQDAVDGRAFLSAGRAFVVSTTGDWLFYDAGPDWFVSTPPFGFVAFDAAWDGSTWWVVGRDAATLAPRLAKSTDGAAAQTWQVIAPTTPPPDGLWTVEVAQSARLVSAGADGLYTSDDAGGTWIERCASSFDYAFSDVQHWGDGIISAVGSVDFCVSFDNGTTWSVTQPRGGSYKILSCAYAGANGWALWPQGHIRFGDPVVGGWTAHTAARAGVLSRAISARNGIFYTLERVGSVIRLQTLGEAFAADSVLDESTITPPVAVGTSPASMTLGAGRIAVWVPSAFGDVLYLYALGGEPAEIALAWPVEVVAPVYVVSGWPVTVAAAPEVHIAAPWAVSVSAAATIEAAWPVAVLNADVVGGLDGAGAWAAAPDGQWEAIVTLGGVDISDRLSGDCVVQIAANAARTAEFAFLPAATLAPMGLIGQRVTMAFAQRGRFAVQAIFSGVVDVPEVDVVTGRIACSCTDQAQEMWAQMPRASIDALVGGRWHVAVSGESEDGFSYMQERLKSVAASWALDVQQQPRILPWRSPARTLTVRAADIISDVGLRVGLPSRDQLRTRVVCRLQYRYQLLRYRGISAQYAQPVQFYMPVWGVDGGLIQPTKLMMTSAMVEGAAESMPGWDLQSLSIEHPPARSWNLGNELRPYFFIISASVAPTLAAGFRAAYSTRWQQSVTEDYAITVVWGALESQLDAAVPEEIGATLEATFDQRDWGSDASVAPALGAGTGDAKMPWQPNGTDAAARDEVLRVLLDQAWVRLWDASRSGRVEFALPCRPDLWLDTAVMLDHPRLRAAGDIVEIEHALSLESGSAITSVTVAVGMPGNAAAPHPDWTLPAPPVDPYAPPLSAFSCEIGTYVGGTIYAPEWDPETMVGFSTNHQGNLAGAQYYPHQLRIKSPPLAAEDRDPRELPVVADITVAVPTDLLEIL